MGASSQSSDSSPKRSPTGLLGAALGFSLGIGLFSLLPALPPVWLFPSFSLLLALGAYRVPALWPLFWLCLGMSWIGIRTAPPFWVPLPEPLIRQDLQVVGHIAGMPEPRKPGLTFLFHIDQTRWQGKAVDFQGLVRLRWYRNAPALRAGEAYRLTVRLKPPRGFANPGGFDYERWLWQQGIRATGYVRAHLPFQRVDEGPGPYFVQRWRQQLRDRLHAALGDAVGGGLIRAWVLGDRSGLDTTQREILFRTGTAHLLAISGLHVGILAGALFFALRWLWSRSAFLVQRLAAPRAAALGAFVGALCYSALAGFALPTQRALIMLAVVLAALFWGRVLRASSGLALALLGVLLLDPLALLSQGFWLSFTAVAAVIYGLSNRLGTGKRSWFRTQWLVTLALFPLLLLFFGRASWVAPLVNFLVLPLFSLLLPAVLVATGVFLLFDLATPLQFLSHWIGQGWEWLSWVSAWPWAAGSLPGQPWWVWCLALFGIFLLLSPAGLPGRWLGVPLCLPLFLLPPSRPSPGTAWFSLLDVGQGLSAVVQTRHHVLVYDTGPGFPSGFNAGAAVLVPFLREQGWNQIDTLILSHRDQDHQGGLRGLLDADLPIRRTLAGGPLDSEPVPMENCRAGQRWSWDGVDFQILHPDQPGRSGNAGSCVLRVSTRGASLLLPGDVPRSVEKALIASGKPLAASLLVAGHHGSKTSSSGAFLKAVQPRWMLYSAGAYNRYGFPHEAVCRRMEQLGIRQLNTAHTGSISFALTPEGLEGPALYRREHPRFWRSHPPLRMMGSAAEKEKHPWGCSH